MDRKLLRVLVLLAVVSSLLVAWRVSALEAENSELRRRLQDALVPQRPLECPVVQIVCECLEYEQEWDDAEFVGGCDPETLDAETIESLCGEFDLYGYMPHC